MMNSGAFSGGDQNIDHRTSQQGTGDAELLDKQRHVQRKLGRCLLLLQQYELMAKHLVAHYSLAGTSVAEIEADRAAREEARAACAAATKPAR